MYRSINWDNRQILTDAAGISAYYVEYFASARFVNFYYPRRYAYSDDYSMNWHHIVRAQALAVVYACQDAACEQIARSRACN